MANQTPPKKNHEDKEAEEYLIQPHDGRTVWNGVESKDDDTESKEKEYEYKQKEEKTGSDDKNSDEISLEELDGEGNEKLMKQGDEVKSKEKYRHRWHVSDVLRKIKVVQSGMKIVWQSIEESDTFIWQPPWR